jgi:hypothetical protein
MGASGPSGVLGHEAVPPGTTTRSTRPSNLPEVIDLLRRYAKQEIVGPLQGIGRWIGLGAAASLCLGVGFLSLSISLLRAMQQYGSSAFSGYWSWVPYLVTILFQVLVLYLALRRVSRTGLTPQEHPS